MSEKQIKISTLNVPTLLDLELPKPVKELIKTLTKEKAEIYLIGGFVRDMLIGRLSYDLDFVVVDKSALELGKELALKHDGNCFLLDKLTETTRVMLKEEVAPSYTFDFTPVLKSNLEADFARRDFTINTLAINLKELNILIDKFSGLDDLNQKKIKAVKSENLLDDPLRFIRAFRFAAYLQCEIEPELFYFIKSNLDDKKVSSLLKSVAGERISTELWKILDNDNSSKYIRQMADVGLLEEIMPELTPMRKVTPNSHHHLWLFDHSLELVKTFEENFHKIPEWAKQELNNPFSASASPVKKSVAKLGALLHDVGKPSTWEIKKNNGEEKHTFYGHDKVGAEITKDISEKLKFSNLIQETISRLVRYHLRPFQLQQGDAPITDRALYRFFRDVGEDMPLLLMLAMADLYATCGPKITKEDLSSGEKLILFLFDEYKKYKTREIEAAKKPKLLDGNEVMKLTGLKPSPILGQVMKELDEAIAVGEIKTKEEAKNWVLLRCKAVL
ncbi:MAG: HD domain-containing protein [Candidatus Melainabacteria bacterium]|nr:HD domain-containing protein [Candidatus Melainabacteria bacterium]